MNALLYGLVLLCWGTTWFAVTLQVESHVSPIVSVAWRFLLASAMVFGWCLMRRKPLRFPLSYHRNWLVIGIFLFCANFICVYYGTPYLTSGVVALIFSTITIFTIINGALWFQKPIVMRTMLGSVMGVIGLATVFSNELTATATNAADTIDYAIAPVYVGLLLVLLGTCIASLGMLTSGKIQARNVPLMQSNAYGMLYGSLTTFAVALLFGEQISFDTRNTYLGSLVFLALFGSVVGFGVYLKLLSRIGADRAAYANVFTPIIALTISAFFEDYEWTLMNLIGITLVITGNLMVLWKPQERKAEIEA